MPALAVIIGVLMLGSLTTAAEASTVSTARPAAANPPCSTAPTLQRVNASFAPDPNHYYVQLVATCPGMIGSTLYYFRVTAPSGKQFVGVNSDSNPNLPPTCNGTRCQPAPGCSSLGAAGMPTLTCNTEYNEPDGQICAQFTVSADPVPGDQFKIELLDAQFNPIPGYTSTQALPATLQPQCTGAAEPP